MVKSEKVGTDETTALQGGRVKDTLLAVADGDTAVIAATPRIVPTPPRHGQWNGIKPAIARGYAGTDGRAR
jgi:hypothetical protein